MWPEQIALWSQETLGQELSQWDDQLWLVPFIGVTMRQKDNNYKEEEHETILFHGGSITTNNKFEQKSKW